MGTEGGSNLIDDSKHTVRYGTSHRGLVLCGGQLRRSKGHIGPRMGVQLTPVYTGAPCKGGLRSKAVSDRCYVHFKRLMYQILSFGECLRILTTKPQFKFERVESCS